VNALVQVRHGGGPWRVMRRTAQWGSAGKGSRRGTLARRHARRVGVTEVGVGAGSGIDLVRLAALLRLGPG
jgi:hypothetical protein